MISTIIPAKRRPSGTKQYTCPQNPFKHPHFAIIRTIRPEFIEKKLRSSRFGVSNNELKPELRLICDPAVKIRPMNPPAAICSILLACGFLTIGRLLIRRAKRSQPRPHRCKKFLGWLFLFAGLIAMIFGVLMW